MGDTFASGAAELDWHLTSARKEDPIKPKYNPPLSCKIEKHWLKKRRLESQNFDQVHDFSPLPLRPSKFLDFFKKITMRRTTTSNKYAKLEKIRNTDSLHLILSFFF